MSATDCGPCGGTGKVWLVLSNQAAACPHCHGSGVREHGIRMAKPLPPPEPFTIFDKDTLGRGGLG